MKMIKYVAFIRAINVGGKNLIRMNKLKKIFESLACKNVITYIQSGNVLFNSNIRDEKKLINKIEKELHKILSDDVVVILRTSDELKKIVSANPFTKINIDISSKSYLTLLKNEVKLKIELPFFSPKKDFEVVKTRKRELYFISHQIKGKYGFPNVLIEKELGENATTRNWRTIIKVNELLRESALK